MFWKTFFPHLSKANSNPVARKSFLFRGKNNNKTLGSVKLFLATGFEFVCAITALYFRGSQFLSHGNTMTQRETRSSRLNIEFIFQMLSYIKPGFWHMFVFKLWRTYVLSKYIGWHLADIHSCKTIWTSAAWQSYLKHKWFGVGFSKQRWM